MATWTIVAVSVTRVEEQIGLASFPPEQYLAGFDRELLQRHLPWLVPHHYSPEHDRLVTSVHSWLIRTDRHTILLDSCLLYTSPSPRDGLLSRMPSSA